MECPLCLVADLASDVRGADDRRYYLCNHCWLIFADSCHRLTPAEERAHYQTHQNHIENEGYVRFLRRLLDPMLPYLDCTMRGLDYGCGPGPVLSELARRHGIACDDYDPLFVNRSLEPPYDFVFATECFEHFHRPAVDIGQIRSLLRPGGLLGVMTERWTTREAFATWYYSRDPTHVSFYHERTFRFLCDRFGLAPLWHDAGRVVVLRRSR